MVICQQFNQLKPDEFYDWINQLWSRIEFTSTLCICSQNKANYFGESVQTFPCVKYISSVKSNLTPSSYLEEPNFIGGLPAACNLLIHYIIPGKKVRLFVLLSSAEKNTPLISRYFVIRISRKKLILIFFLFFLREKYRLGPFSIYRKYIGKFPEKKRKILFLGITFVQHLSYLKNLFFLKVMHLCLLKKIPFSTFVCYSTSISIDLPSVKRLLESVATILKEKNFFIVSQIFLRILFLS